MAASVLGVCLAWHRTGLGIKSCLVCDDPLAQSLSNYHAFSPSLSYTSLSPSARAYRENLPPQNRPCFECALLFIQTRSRSISDL